MPSNRLRNDIFSTCFVAYNGPLANGELANNKLDLERIGGLPELRQRVSGLLADRVKPYMPGLIIPVPNGANWLGADIGDILGIDVMGLGKNDVTKEIFYLNGGKEKVASTERAVVIDDVFNKFTNTNRVLELDGMTHCVKALASIVDRNPNRDDPPALPHFSLVREHIPQILLPGSEYWQFIKTS